MSCPICNSETTQDYRPFCSRRCADVDMARWFNGHYAVPSREPEDIEAAIEATETAQKEPPKPH